MTDKKLDSLLASWPLPERTPLDVDEAAGRVVDALRAGEKPLRSAAIDDATLLSPPLPQRPEEGQTSPREPSAAPGRLTLGGTAVENKMSKERGRDRTSRSSFQELAKLASMPPSAPTPTPPPTSASSSGPTGVVRGEEASSDDSGIVDLKAIATADPAAAQRAQATPLAAEGLFDEDAPPPASATLPAQSAPPTAAAVASAAPPPVTAAPQAAARAAAPGEKKKGGGIVIAIGAIVALSAVAAGGFFVVKSRLHAKETPVAATTVAAPDTAQTAAATATAPAASVADTEPSASDDSTNLDNLPEDSPQKARLRKITATSGKPIAKSTTGTDAKKPPPAGSVDPKLIANIPTGGGGNGNSGDFNDALKHAAGGGMGVGKDATQTAAAVPTGNVPQKPSQGMVVGAIGQVLPKARSCVNEGEPISHATVVFGSMGTVKSVSVSGFAAGRPAEACIKAALGKAKVQPFAEPSYSFPVTIRSN